VSNLNSETSRSLVKTIVAVYFGKRMFSIRHITSEGNTDFIGDEMEN